MRKTRIVASGSTEAHFSSPELDATTALVEAEDRYRTLVENLPAVTYICGVDDQDVNIYVSPQLEEILGVRRQEMLDEPDLWLRLIHPEDLERVDNEWTRFKRHGQEFRSEYRMVVNGEIKWMQDRAIMLSNSDGGPPLAQGFLVDITERRHSQWALLEAEERYRSLVEHIPAITYIYETDQAENTVFMSPQVEAILGYTPAEMLGAPGLWWDLVHPEDRDRVVTDTERFNKEGDSYRGEYRMIARDGTEVWIQDEARLLRDESGRPKRAQGVLIDISERKHLEEQLRQSQRMEAVGRLAGGVAHDFNNLLAVIQNYARFLFEDLAETDPRREDAGEILAAGERATTLVRQLLTFSRKEAVELQVLDLNDVVVDMEKLLRRSIGEDVRLETRLGEGLWPCKVDQGQMEQVIANLAVNSRDAMPDGGPLIIETENVTQPEGWLAQYAGPAVERYVCVTITDSGKGIAPEDRDYIFEPFFTTKERGKGTGLGLAMVHGIVHGAGGHVSVYPTDGGGTTIKVFLPASHETAVKEERRPARTPMTATGRGETIVVVEDDAAIRTLVDRILGSKGYDVVAMGPEEALEMFESDFDIDLLLTDVVMPIASGKVIADRVLSRSPECPVVFMSGYTDDIISRHQVTAGEGSDFLEKPFSAHDLLSIVEKAIRRRTARTN